MPPQLLPHLRVAPVVLVVLVVRVPVLLTVALEVLAAMVQWVAARAVAVVAALPRLQQQVQLAVPVVTAVHRVPLVRLVPQ